MRPGQNKRMRGRNNNNRKGPNPLTRSYESNGPDVKIRGTAFHIGEKYLQLARDAQSSGDPVMAESYLQHAEHYFRLIAAAQQAQQQAQFGHQRQPGETAVDDDGDEDEDFASVPDRFASPSERAQVPQAQPFNGQAGQNGQPYGGQPYNNDRQGNERQGNDRQGGDRQGGDRNERSYDNRNRGYGDRQNNDRNGYGRDGDRSGQDRAYQERSADRQGQDRYQGQDRQYQDRQGQDRQGQDRNQNQDRYQGQDRQGYQGQDRQGQGYQGQDRQGYQGQDRQGQDRQNQDRQNQDRYQGQPRDDRQGRENDRGYRNRERQPRDYRDQRDGGRDVRQPSAEEPATALPAFITAPVRTPADSPPSDAPSVAPQPEQTGVEAVEDAGFHMRPRRRRRTKAENGNAESAPDFQEAVADDPVAD